MRILTLLIALLGMAALAQDPSKVEIENQWVRVVRTKLGPRAKITMPQHPAEVVIRLTDFRQRIIYADGVVRELRGKTGDVGYLDAAPQAHAEENLLDIPVEMLFIELKSGPSGTPPVTLDPVRLDPRHVSVALENERVRVLRTIMEPHLKGPLHEHPHYVVVYLNETHRSMKLADGTTVNYQRKAGEAAWRDALKHATENLDDHTAAELQVEIK
jgi:hypothetical protein